MNPPAIDVAQRLFNPFVGLRPFEESEAHLFFGRDGQSDEIVNRLAQRRFVAVVGGSGSGKSSLVRAGVFPDLRGGFMATAGSHWRIACLRPGNAPIGSLAERCTALCASPRTLLMRCRPRSSRQRCAARRSGSAKSSAKRGSPRGDNVLVVVDQFEELFRYKRVRAGASADDDAAAFVKLLIEAPQATGLPIYVMLTMRSDFLGDCAQFRGLPETMNDSQYLVPRMNRDERRQAIEGPVGVGGAAISPRLVQRLLNDVGEDPDQLPILQHALMRNLAALGSAPRCAPDARPAGLRGHRHDVGRAVPRCRRGVRRNRWRARPQHRRSALQAADRTRSGYAGDPPSYPVRRALWPLPARPRPKRTR